MARTTEEILAAMIAEKDKHPVLAQLTDNNAGTYWYNLFYLFALFVHEVEVFFDTFKTDIIKTNIENQLFTADWFARQAKAFQYGDNLRVSEGLLGYEFTDTEKQIVKRAACISLPDGGAIVKVAAENPDGSIRKLSDAEMIAFNDYMSELIPPGSLIDTFTAEPDLLKLTASVYYDPEAIEAEVLEAVIAAVKGFLADLPFTGSFKISDLSAVLSGVEGVTDYAFTQIQTKAEGGVYSDVNRIYETESGTLQIDPDFPLSDTLTMLTD